jgi:hypothetical protein
MRPLPMRPLLLRLPLPWKTLKQQARAMPHLLRSQQMATPSQPRLKSPQRQKHLQNPSSSHRAKVLQQKRSELQRLFLEIVWLD